VAEELHVLNSSSAPNPTLKNTKSMEESDLLQPLLACTFLGNRQMLRRDEEGRGGGGVTVEGKSITSP